MTAGKRTECIRKVPISRMPEYNSWSNMVRRCHSPRHPRFKDWGGKGISVCPRWRMSFLAFLEDMGSKPAKGYSVDRIDGSMGYFPSNCRWATPTQQSENRPSFIRRITFKGRTQSLAAWCRELGINREMVKYRLDQGIEFKVAIETKSGSIPRKNSRTGVKGVSPHGRKFRAVFRGKYVGVYETIDDAIAAIEGRR